jgi:hypothetical protein
MTVITISQNSDGNYYATKNIDGSTYTTTYYAISEQYKSGSTYYTESDAYVNDIKHDVQVRTSGNVQTTYTYNNGKVFGATFSGNTNSSVDVDAGITNDTFIARKVTKSTNGTNTVYNFLNSANNSIGTVTYSPETNSFTTVYNTLYGNATSNYQNLAIIACGAIGHNFFQNGTGDPAVIQSMYAMIDSVVNYV